MDDDAITKRFGELQEELRRVRADNGDKLRRYYVGRAKDARRRLDALRKFTSSLKDRTDQEDITLTQAATIIEEYAEMMEDEGARLAPPSPKGD